eukprot:scaffold56435_cov65-Phaeocystis_antarctica.AAC.2
MAAGRRVMWTNARPAPGGGVPWQKEDGKEKEYAKVINGEGGRCGATARSALGWYRLHRDPVYGCPRDVGW